jgi:hypothetical protein
MSTTKNSIISAIKVIVISTLLISGAYVIFIPVLAPDYKTYYILAVGLAIAALIGGYIGYQAPENDISIIKIGFGFCYAIVTTTLVFLFSLIIILNIRGA